MVIMMKFDYKIPFNSGTSLNVKFINEFCRNHPGKRILVEVQNTKGITSRQLYSLDTSVHIRIAGGYDKNRFKHQGTWQFDNGETGEYYISAVVYSRNEAIKIVEEIEKIESGINANWSHIQKLVYIYDKLKRDIMYDPKFEKKTSAEIRSLRGLITKKTVCAGYALILKEFLDRQGIICEYVEGCTKKDGSGGHAWNIVTIEGKKYPIDLTWDNTKFRTGKFNTYDFLGQDVRNFADTHFPASWAPTQNYRYTLSQLDPELIKKISSQIIRSRDVKSTIYYGSRRDGTKFVVVQLGDVKALGNVYYRFLYADVLKNDKVSNPQILYSRDNITEFIERRKFGKSVTLGYNYAVGDILLSKENISDSIRQRTCYIGSALENNRLVSSVKEISKSAIEKNTFSYPTKQFTRSDGSTFIVQQMFTKPVNIDGTTTNIIYYHVFEMVKENGENVLKANVVCSERNFFNDNRQGIADDYLSRSRLDRKAKETGGYIGYYDYQGRRTYNPKLNSLFETSKKIDINSYQNETSDHKTTRR